MLLGVLPIDMLPVDDSGWFEVRKGGNTGDGCGWQNGRYAIVWQREFATAHRTTFRQSRFSLASESRLPQTSRPVAAALQLSATPARQALLLKCWRDGMMGIKVTTAVGLKLFTDIFPTRLPAVQAAALIYVDDCTAVSNI